MDRKTRGNRIDLTKMLLYMLKRAWLIVLCAEIGFGAMYYYTTRCLSDTYTASGTMYVNNVNPNLSDSQYVNYSDLSTARKLIDTYLVVVKSEKVMNAVVERLSKDHPDITAGQISPTLSMASVSETGVVAVSSRTSNAQLSADIVNAVMEDAPEEIIRVVGGGSVEIIDSAKVPIFPDSRGEISKGRRGAMYGAAVGALILAILFLLNQKVTSVDDIKDNYNPPVLASLQRVSAGKAEPSAFMLNNQSPMEVMESYAKLRMNLLYTLVGKKSHSVVITSSISGEGKTTIAANLAISCAMGGKKVLLVDADLRRGCQRDVFEFDKHSRGLSDALVGKCKWQDTILKDIRETLDLMPAGHFPPNPAELLASDEMRSLLVELEQEYDLVLLDMPPVNIVADPLVLSDHVAGCLFVTRQNFSDHRDIKKALIEAEMTGMNVLGFIFYGENINQGGYYSRRYYRSYYNKYDYRRRTQEARDEMNAAATGNVTGVAESAPNTDGNGNASPSSEGNALPAADESTFKSSYIK